MIIKQKPHIAASVVFMHYEVKVLYEFLLTADEVAGVVTDKKS
jgi:hypothetical protein